ncbi:MAG: 50S ribosomal protein L25 [Candidatus Pacebacteria bacterium]|nr:50S ribosomal protein L25 [Candidatus Paceibacterota bacterium]
MTTILAAEKRTEIGKASQKLAGTERMAAIVYGPKQEAISISLPTRDFVRVLRDEGESSVLELSGLGKNMQVLIHDVDRDPVTGLPRHADFYAIEKGAKVEVAVPLEFIGESAAVKLGANLVKVLHELEVEAAPENLPHQIEVDISVLQNVGDQIHVRDLKLPQGVTTTVDEDEVVALTQEVEEEEESTAGPDMAAIEVEQKGKAEEGEEA